MGGQWQRDGGRRPALVTGAWVAGVLATLIGAPALAQQGGDTIIGVGRVDGQHQYVLDYAKQDGVVLTTNGVAYRFLRKGPPVGNQPARDGQVRVHYEGKLTTGQVFDSSYKRDETAVMSLTKVIPAWQEVIPLMHVGDKLEMVVPSEMGYGQRGSPDGGIPPGATLIFKVELYEVMPREVAPKH